MRSLRAALEDALNTADKRSEPPSKHGHPATPTPIKRRKRCNTSHRTGIDALLHPPREPNSPVRRAGRSTNNCSNAGAPSARLLGAARAPSAAALVTPGSPNARRHHSRRSSRQARSWGPRRRAPLKKSSDFLPTGAKRRRQSPGSWPLGQMATSFLSIPHYNSTRQWRTSRPNSSRSHVP